MCPVYTLSRSSCILAQHRQLHERSSTRLRGGIRSSCLGNSVFHDSCLHTVRLNRSKLHLRHYRRSSLRKLLASDPEDAARSMQTTFSTSSTLAVLDLLLGVAKQQQEQQDQQQQQQQHQEQHQQPAREQASTCSMQQPGGSILDAEPPRSSRTAVMLSQEAIWSEAWNSLEASQTPASRLPDTGQQAVPQGKRLQRFRPFGNHEHREQHLNGKERQQQGIHQGQVRDKAVPRLAIKQAQLHLQGLETKAKLQLVALSLAALERNVAALRGAHVRLTLAEWQQVSPSLLAACSCQAAVAWLGSCPEALQSQALQVVCHLQRGTSSASSIGIQQVSQIIHSQLQPTADGIATSPASTEAVTPTAGAQAATDEAEAAGAPAASSSKGLWQSAAENCPVHAVILQDMCQQHPAAASGRDEHAVGLAEQSTRQASHSASAQTQSNGSSSSQQTSSDTAQNPDFCTPPASLGSTIQVPFSTAPAPDDPQSAASLSGSASPHDSPSTPPPEVSMLSDTATAPMHSSSGVRSAAHRRLANPNRQQLRQAVSQQHEAAAFQAVLQAAPAVLQDMAVNIAEAVGMCYLAEARSGLQGGSSSSNGWWPLHLHARLRSTRSLERFRNQIALTRLVHQNVHSVAAIYEDRHNLVTIGPEMQLMLQPVAVRRVKELEALKGWQYFLSFMLEAGDVLLPVARSCMARVSAAVSWLLVKLIGRALGLIFRGVRQSLTPQAKPKSKQETSGNKGSRDEGQHSWFPGFA